MRLDPQNVQNELSVIMDRYAGAMKRVVDAYVQRRTPERDINWVALQATKEYGAMMLHARTMFRKAKAMDRLQSIRKSCEDSFEEAEHYWGLMNLLNWYLEGKPCEVKEMWGYGDFSETNGPGPGMKESLWPESYRYFAMGQDIKKCSQWVQEVISTNVEGAAAAFHYLMSQIPPKDEFLKRVAEHEKSIAQDELHHGPQMLRELAANAPSERELDEAIDKLKQLRVQELRQRNEQFLHPLTPAEMKQLEDDFLQGRIDPIAVFSVAA